ncbi:hypothetical protein Tco_1417666 [Tanacetum coccineum]
MTQAAIRKLVTNSIAATLEEIANIAQRLMDQVLKHGSVQGTNDHKRKFDDRRNATSNNNNYRNNNHNNNYHQQQNRRQESVRTHAATSTKNKKYTENKRYAGNLPWCTRCTLHHTGICNVKCQTCNKGPSTYSLASLLLIELGLNFDLREVVMVGKSKMVISSLPSVPLVVVAYKEVMEITYVIYRWVVNKVMSSPNHPTSDIEDAFFSNFPDYTPTSLDYFPVSPGNMSPDP